MFLQGSAKYNLINKKIQYNYNFYDLLNIKTNITNINSINQVKVGVIDTGFDLNNPSLTLIPVNKKNVNYRGKHGNAVSGIIGAKKTNFNDFSGIIPGFPLYIYDINSKNLNVYSLTKAIKRFIELKVDIINISLATPIYDENLYGVVKEATDKGIIIVASSGNSGDDTYYYPASFEIPGVISVGATNSSNDILSESTVNDRVDIWAPGENIFSIGEKFTDVERFTGTSFSTPIVTSLIIILKMKCPHYGLEDIENMLKKGASVYTGSWQNKTREIYLVNYEKTLNLCLK
ncbi:subtilisin [Parageobacillus thermantarcticus]|uniref:Subtilisin n=1 Tax=Parageobacillus thermantarcticus TaxID=186116 RepID=A0A1I0THH7_9BACL|nr:S8 family serine peptidase [Parageobacillus thermantarcticus]SFA51258.1 subtilisin [Parageobacillus thermantarcticus]